MSRWVRFFNRRKRMLEALDQDIRDYIERETQDNIERGMPPEEARYAALRKFGNVARVKEETWKVWSFVWLEQLWQDVRYGLRMLRKAPGFTAVAVLTLALGIGVNTAIFSLVDQLLLWSVPAREPNRLVRIEGFYSKSYPFFCAYRDLNQVFDGVLASSDNLDAGIRTAGAPGVELGHVEYVSGGYFQVLGIGSAAGRVLTPSDDAPGRPPVAVLSYRYWQRRFGGDLRVIGQKIDVNTYPLAIVGVAEEGFGGLFNGDQPDAFIPLAMYAVTNPGAASALNSVYLNWLSLVARLKPGVSIQQAQAGMPVLWKQAIERVNDPSVRAVTKAHLLQKDEFRLTPAARAPSFIRNQRFLDPLKALVVATVLVLLVACANVASLLLARASQQWRETAVRLAIGATPGRLIRQFLTESLVLAAMGSAAGLGVAAAGVRALASLDILDPGFRFHLSLFVLASCAGLTLLTSIACGLVPALRAARMTLGESMKEGGSAAQAVSRSRISKLLVTNQVALSLILLIAASLFVRTLRNLQNVDLGFEREKVAVFDIDPTKLGYTGVRLRTFYEQLLAHVRLLHGVRSAALSAMTPISGYSRSIFAGSPDSSEPPFSVSLNPVSPGYFTTLGIPLLSGRDFRSEDKPVGSAGNSVFIPGRSSGGGKWVDASRVCIIDETLARQQFGTANVVGRRFCYHARGCPGEPGIEIVGVAKAAHYYHITASDETGLVYEPSWSNGAEVRWLLVRFAGSAAPVVAGVRRALQDEDANVPLLHVRMMQEYVNAFLAHERLIAYLSGFFAVLALGLATVGIYGVLAYAVTRRIREIGIRRAMGARPADVFGLIFRESVVSVAAGVVIGLAAAFSWSLLLGSLLYGVDSFDLQLVSFSVAVMLTAAALAVAVPARRATKVDPMVALRYE
jgi:predicted permease